MAIPPEALHPVTAFALVGVLGVGAQLIAWRLRMPAIVLMLVAGVVAGPVTGLLDPAREFGALREPMIAMAVAIILFEGGLTLNVKSLQDAAKGVRRLVIVGAPLGWLLSALTLHYAAGLGWETAAVFGGIMIVTGPTVIAPLLRSARLSRRPAQILQWEAIVNDPIGALAAVLAFEVVSVVRASQDMAHAIGETALGIVVAVVAGFLAGAGLAWAFRRGRVPEYMKVPVLFALLLAVFAFCDALLHESGLLAVTVMGIVIANAGLPSFEEMRRFKEHATILLVSGVFILLAAGLDFGELSALNWRAAIFVGVIMLVARPVTVLVSLIGSGVPWRERALVAFTGPRGVVLVAVAGLFGERLVSLGVEDGALVGPLAFALVAVTVVVHGFALRPMARALGLTGAETPGLLIVGGSRFTTALAACLKENDIPVLLADPNHGKLRAARRQGLPNYYGDILAEAAEHRLDLVSYATLFAATDNDAYNTLVATDLAHHFGRDAVFQLARSKDNTTRHALPATLGGKPVVQDLTHDQLETKLYEGWHFHFSRLTEEFTMEDWRAENPASLLVGAQRPGQILRLLHTGENLKGVPDMRLIHIAPAQDAAEARQNSQEARKDDPKDAGTSAV
ncbi:cation:proton antiporter [Pseudooceanicola aestuarii]|uniref:cation:proton antiporter n=1 Tax=Pseudooceanicola aestuarii TaxID=2697319 RepID=UPI0013D241D2|nr:sodium:proton antiporter [Pseudooceanicola aestuarii]